MQSCRFAWPVLALFFAAGCSSPSEPGQDAPTAEVHPTRVLLVEGYPRWEYRYLKNVLLRDKSVVVDTWLNSTDSRGTMESSPGRTPLQEFPATREQLAMYDVVILGDLSPVLLQTADLTAEQCLQNIADWVVTDGGGLILIAGQASMPKLWEATALDSVLPVKLEAPLPEPADNYRYTLTDRGILSSICRFAADPAPPAEAWLDRDQRGDGLRGLRWVLSTSCRPGAQVLVECGPEDHRVPLFVIRESGRGRVFFSATDETWRWRFACGDEPWFHPFWSRVIHWARFGE